MGYKPIKKIYAITFEDCPGLLVRAKSTNLGKLFEVSNMRITVLEQDEEKRMLAFVIFAKNLVEWNIEHPEIDDFDPTALNIVDGPTCPRCGLKEGDSLPATADAMLCLDLDFVIKLIMGWIEATSRVALPKESNLNAGEMNTQELGPTERLAAMQSPLTLPMPS